MARRSPWLMPAVALLAGGAIGAALVLALRPAGPPPDALGAPTVAVQTVQAPLLLRIGTGALTGAYFPVGGAICQVFNARRAEDGPFCAVLPSGGSQDNIAALRAGALEFAIVQSDWQFHALHGSAALAGASPMTELRSVMSLHKEPLTLVARRGAGIAKLADLKGKRVNLGAPGSGARALMDAVARAMGWRTDDFAAVSSLDAAAQVDALCAGEIDAAAFASGHPNGLIGAATQNCEGVLVPLEGPQIDRLLADNPFFARATIQGGLYPGNAEPVESFGVAATLVATDRLAPDVVTLVVDAVFADLEQFQALHPALAGLAPDAMTRDGLTAPPHAGALSFYRAQGWM